MPDDLKDHDSEPVFTSGVVLRGVLIGIIVLLVCGTGVWYFGMRNMDTSLSEGSITNTDNNNSSNNSSGSSNPTTDKKEEEKDKDEEKTDEEKSEEENKEETEKKDEQAGTESNGETSSGVSAPVTPPSTGSGSTGSSGNSGYTAPSTPAPAPSTPSAPETNTGNSGNSGSNGNNSSSSGNTSGGGTSTPTVPTPSVEKYPAGNYVMIYNMIIRNQPYMSAASVGEYTAGSEVKMYQVQPGNDGRIWGLSEQGWVCLCYGTQQYGLNAGSYYFPYNMKIRSEPSMDAEQVGSLSGGSTVTVQRIVFRNGSDFWGEIAENQWVCLVDLQQFFAYK